MICVYKILSPDKQKCYVGSTKDYKERIYHHKSSSNNCKSKLLFEEFGFDNCEFVIVEQCLEEELETKEQWWMDHSYGLVNKKTAVYDRAKYLNDNRAKINEQARKRAEANRDKINERRRSRPKEKIICECGMVFASTNLSRHIKSGHLSR